MATSPTPVNAGPCACGSGLARDCCCGLDWSADDVSPPHGAGDPGLIVDGTLMYVLGFGATDRATLAGDYDRMAKSFTFEELAFG
jgi:hypothetical protein